MDQRRARGGPRPGTTGTGSPATTGAALVAGLLVLLAAGLAAGARRPPLTGDGAWSTPLQLLLGIGALGLLVLVLLVLQGVVGQRPRPRPGRGDRWGLLVSVALLLLVAAVVQRLTPPTATDPGGDGGGGGLPEGVVPDVVAVPPVTPTTVVAGVLALVLLALLAVRALRSVRGRGRSGPQDDDHAGVPAPDAPAGLPEGPPAAVVLAAYDRARALATPMLHAPTRESPARLLARAHGTPLHTPLATLTALHLPVRYGRAGAGPQDAAAARAALDLLERRLAPARSVSPTSTPGPAAGPGTDGPQ